MFLFPGMLPKLNEFFRKIWGKGKGNFFEDKPYQLAHTTRIDTYVRRRWVVDFHTFTVLQKGIPLGKQTTRCVTYARLR